MALTYYAQLEMDMGRSRDALVRLLERALRRPSDPYLLAGLVQAARYCGLVEVSIAAHEQARRLDPQIPTAVANSYWLKGDYVRVLDVLGAEPNLLRGMALAAMGRIDEAIASYADDEVRAQGTAEGEFAALSRLICEERFEEAEPRILGLLASPTFLDPEAHVPLDTRPRADGEA